MTTPKEGREIADQLESVQFPAGWKMKEAAQALRDLANQVESLQRAVEALQEDAERYRYLRDAHPADETLWVAMGVPGSPAGVSCWRNEPLDAAIDAAREQS